MAKLNQKLFDRLRGQVPYPRDDRGSKEAEYWRNKHIELVNKATKKQLKEFALSGCGTRKLVEIMGEEAVFVWDSTEYDKEYEAFREKHNLIDMAELQFLAGDDVAAKELIAKVLG